MSQSDGQGAITIDSEHPRVEVQVMGMFNKIGHLLTRPFYRQFIAEHEISLTEWRVLTWVERLPGTVAQEVSSRTGMAPMNVSRALAALRDKDLVRSERDPGDTRRNNLWLTHRGREVFDLIEPVAIDDITRTLSVLTPDELVFLRSLLRRIIVHAEELESATVELDTK